MNNKLNAEMIMNLSAIIDKMEITENLKELDINTGDKKKDNEELGKELIILFISKLYKAKDEVYELIANYKNCDIEEAKKADIITIVKEIINTSGVLDFLS